MDNARTAWLMKVSTGNLECESATIWLRAVCGDREGALRQWNNLEDKITKSVVNATHVSCGAMACLGLFAIDLTEPAGRLAASLPRNAPDLVGLFIRDMVRYQLVRIFAALNDLDAAFNLTCSDILEQWEHIVAQLIFQRRFDAAFNVIATAPPGAEQASLAVRAAWECLRIGCANEKLFMDYANLTCELLS
jgi:hypothetical protein